MRIWPVKSFFFFYLSLLSLHSRTDWWSVSYAHPLDPGIKKEEKERLGTYSFSLLTGQAWPKVTTKWHKDCGPVQRRENAAGHCRGAVAVRRVLRTWMPSCKFLPRSVNIAARFIPGHTHKVEDPDKVCRCAVMCGHDHEWIGTYVFFLFFFSYSRWAHNLLAKRSRPIWSEREEKEKRKRLYRLRAYARPALHQKKNRKWASIAA